MENNTLPKNLQPTTYNLSPFLWFLFSATAMLSAFILPVHIWAVAQGAQLNLGNIYLRIYFFVLLESSLYHGLYRTKTIFSDLGLEKYSRTIGLLLIIIFLFYTLNAASLLFFSL